MVPLIVHVLAKLAPVKVFVPDVVPVIAPMFVKLVLIPTFDVPAKPAALPNPVNAMFNVELNAP